MNAEPWAPRSSRTRNRKEGVGNWVTHEPLRSEEIFNPQKNEDDGKSSMNEDVFPIEHGGFYNVMLVSGKYQE